MAETQPKRGVTTDPPSEGVFISTSMSTLLPAVTHTQSTSDNVLPPVIPNQPPIVSDLLQLNSVSPDIGRVQPLEVSFGFQPSIDTDQLSVGPVLHDLTSIEPAVGPIQPPTYVDLPVVSSVQPVVSSVQPVLNTALSGVNPPAVGPKQSPKNTVLHDLDSIQQTSMDLYRPSMETSALSQPSQESDLHELRFALHPDENSIEPSTSSMESSMDTGVCSSKPTESSVQPPAGTVDSDVNSISLELSLIQPSVEMSMHDMNSFEPSGSPNQVPVDIDSSEVNPTKHAINAAQLKLTDSSSIPAPNALCTKKSYTKRSFTTEFKLECVEHAERTKNKTKTARIFNVNRRRVQEWCTQKEKLMSVPKQQKRLRGGGRRQDSVDPSSKGLQTKGGEVKTDHKLQPPSSKSELDKEVTKDSSTSMPTNVLDPTIFECIARSLSSIDLSMLSPSMVRMLQEWSELTSPDGKAPPMEEPLAQSAPMEDVLQQSSPSSQFLVKMTEDGSPTKSPIEAEMEGNESHSDLAFQHSTSAIQQGVVAVESIFDNKNGHELVNIEGPVVSNVVADVNETISTSDVMNQDSKVNNVEESNSISSLIPENTLDSNVPAAILDALIQVASVQMAPMEQSTEMETASTSATDEQPVKPVTSSSNATGDNRANIEMTPTTTAVRTRVKKCYTVEFKLECIAHAESTSKCAAARQFNVDRRRVQDWCSKKEKLQKLVGDQHILRGARERMDIDVEQQLVAWVKQQQEMGVHLTRKMVGDEATRMYHEKGDMEFLSSIGWVAKFMIRNNISLVARTGLPLQLPPDEMVVEATTSSS